MTSFHTVLGLLICTVLGLCTMALAHENYPKDCCEDQHCRPVNCSEIKSSGDRWYWHGATIEKSKAQPSTDGGCHTCVYNGKMLCLFLGGQV